MTETMAKTLTETLCAVVIAKNEAVNIANCLETLKWCDQVLVIDNESEDGTEVIAERMGARVVSMTGSFAELRNEALKRAKTDWLLYIDADERVTPALAKEIQRVMMEGGAEAASQAAPSAYAINRANVMYGEVFHHGGWQHDWIVRLFKREKLQSWVGEIHEHAEVEGETGRLKEQLIHFTHRGVIPSLQKSVAWTPIEARLLFESGIAPVTASTLLRKTVMEFLRWLFARKGNRDGMAGWVEGLTQAMNRLLVYMQVWELQQKPSIPEKYREYEESIAKLWKKSA